MKKIILAFLVIAMLFTSLISCGGAVEYKDDVSVTALADSAVKKISLSSNLNAASDEFMMFYLNVDASLYTECKVMTPMGSASIDEFGIFKATDAEAAEKINAALSTYLAGRIATWDTRYSQAEKPKVDGAKTTVYGNYVIYTILSSEEQDAFLSAISALLTK
ncbi:MAG: DUF4358 domain-containing protein [Clostridia bacterium]|nr:DUF4358 domain-containing protein [Clostridia bacterium]